MLRVFLFDAAGSTVGHLNSTFTIPSHLTYVPIELLCLELDASGSTERGGTSVCVSEKARPGVVCGGEQRWERGRPVQPSSTDNAPGSSQGGLPKIKLPERYMDEPEALCVCKETQVACGSNNKTYDSVCQMNQEAADSGFPNTLYLKHWGPCRSEYKHDYSSEPRSNNLPCAIVVCAPGYEPRGPGFNSWLTISRATYTPASGMTNRTVNRTASSAAKH
uniref:Kazal-like domain-containing protein n=1 Tax=Timema tahoe TaxID=61484 RepID=A0A7R9FH48_9NEOP|nr:unnamed protein product [Timema tahoe]